MVKLRCDQNCRFGPWTKDSRKELLKKHRFRSASGLLDHNAINTVPRSVNTERCHILVVKNGRVTKFRCTEGIIPTAGFKFVSVAACKGHNDAQLANRDNMHWLSFTSFTGNPEGIDLDLKCRICEKVPEIVPPLALTPSLQTDHCLGSNSDVFTVATPIPVLFVNKEATSKEISDSSAVLWSDTDSFASLLDCFKKVDDHGAINGPQHVLISTFVNATVAHIVNSSIFGIAVPVQLVFLLPDILALNKSQPVLQAKELLLMAMKFDSAQILDPAFYLNLKVNKVQDNNVVSADATTLRDKVKALGQQVARCLFTGIINENAEFMTSSTGKNQQLRTPAFRFVRIGSLLHASKLLNCTALEQILAASNCANISTNLSLSLQCAENTTWLRFNSYSEGLESFLSYMDTNVTNFHGDAWNKALTIDMLSNLDINQMAQVLKKLDLRISVHKQLGLPHPTAGAVLALNDANPPPAKALDTDKGVVDESSKNEKKRKRLEAKQKKKADLLLSKNKKKAKKAEKKIKEKKERKKKKKAKKKKKDQDKFSSDSESDESDSSSTDKVHTFENGFGDMSTLQVQSVVQGFCNDKDHDKKMKRSTAYGAKLIFKKRFTVVCNTENLLVKNVSSGVVKGLEFHLFIQFRWNEINFNFLVRNRGNSIADSNFAPTIGWVSFKEQLELLEILLSTFLGDALAKENVDYLVSVGKKFRRLMINWNMAYSFIRCVLDDFCFRVLNWDGSSYFPKICEPSDRTADKEIQILSRARMLPDPDWSEKWKSIPKICEELCFNDNSKQLLQSQGFDFVKSVMAQLGDVNGMIWSGVGNHDPSNNTSDRLSALESLLAMNKHLAPVVANEPRNNAFQNVQDKRPADSTNGLHCSLISDPLTAIVSSKCPFFTDVRNHFTSGGKKQGWCPFYHADAPPGTTGNILSAEVSKHQDDMRARKLYVPNKGVNGRAGGIGGRGGGNGGRGGGGRGGGRNGARGKGGRGG